MTGSERTSRSHKREFWKRHIEGWLSSGMSQKEYCKKKNISPDCLSWWRSKHFKTIAKKSKVDSVSFVPAILKESQETIFGILPDITFIFPNQTKLLLPSHLAINDLLNIIKSLGGLL